MLKLTQGYDDNNAWKFFFTEDTAGDCGNPTACQLYEVDTTLSDPCMTTVLATKKARMWDTSVSQFHVGISAELATDYSVH